MTRPNVAYINSKGATKTAILKPVQTTTQLPRVETPSQTTEAPMPPPQDFIMKVKKMIRLAQSNHKPTNPPKHNSHSQSLWLSTSKRQPDSVDYHQGNISAVMEILNAVHDLKLGKMQEYKHLIKGINSKLWIKANRKEIARLAQGRVDGKVLGKNTIHFKKMSELPKGRKEMYLRVLIIPTYKGKPISN